MKAKKLVNLLISKNLKIASAESLTGGLFASTIISISGSSSIIDASIVTYANETKIKYCDVKPETITNFDVVSEEVAREMAIGIAKECGSNIGVSFSGIAGPTGGTPERPVGTVCMGICFNGETQTFTKHFSGSRTSVRKKSVNFMIQKLIEVLEN